MNPVDFVNPFRPGAGHTPPHLAGRREERGEFEKLLRQTVITDNMVLTGLRGVGKTVLVDTFKPLALRQGWLWVGSDLSESVSVSEQTLANRILTDLSVVTSSVIHEIDEQKKIGFTGQQEIIEHKLTYQKLAEVYNITPGLVSDKLKYVLELVWNWISKCSPPPRGIVFAYDEAQNLGDQAQKEQFPLSVLLDVFQSIQKKEIPFLLVLTGLPTLFPKLVEARTFAERMFRVVFLGRLSESESREAILLPIQNPQCHVKLSEISVTRIVELSKGYPYFIQFICREVYDAINQKPDSGAELIIPVEEITLKLDTDFFAGRWSRPTDRQRELLRVIAALDNCDHEFTVQEVVDQSTRSLEKSFTASHVGQMLASLTNAGLIYKNRHGRYSFAVPLLGDFIRRQVDE